MWYDKNGSKLLDLDGMWYLWLDGWTLLPEKTDGGDLTVGSKSSKAAESDSAQSTAPALSQRVFSPASPGWGQVQATRAGQE